MIKPLNTLIGTGLFLLLIISFLSVFGYELFGKSIAYGLGLGDLVYVLLSSFFFLVFLVLANLKKIKANTKSKIALTIIIYLTIAYFVYSFTFGRGNEYKWNGEIFYPSTKSHDNTHA